MSKKQSNQPTSSRKILVPVEMIEEIIKHNSRVQREDSWYAMDLDDLEALCEKKHFEMCMRHDPSGIEHFDEDNAPTWLTSEGTVKGSTMDNRWFWKDHVLKLEVGESIHTGFRTITRVK